MQDQIFYPGIFTDEEKRHIATGPLKFLIQNFHYKLNSVPKLVGYLDDTSGTHMAAFCTQEGAYLGGVRQYSDDYILMSPDSDFGGHLSHNSTDYAVSKNQRYLVSAITKERVSRTGFPVRIKRGTELAAEGGVSGPFATLTADFADGLRSLTLKPPSDPPMITAAELSSGILPVVFEDQPVLSIPQALRDKLERIYNHNKKLGGAYDTFNKIVDDMFATNKWVVIPVQSYAPSTRGTTRMRFIVGAVRLTEPAKNVIKDPGSYMYKIHPYIQIVTPFKVYRDVESLPEDLVTNMTMNSMFMRANGTQFVRDTNELVPMPTSHRHAFSEATNSIAVRMTGQTAAYILDK